MPLSSCKVPVYTKSLRVNQLDPVQPELPRESLISFYRAPEFRLTLCCFRVLFFFVFLFILMTLGSSRAQTPNKTVVDCAFRRLP